ncbi:MAG: hypothetical protein WKF88_02900 [Ferruginibacter sp.]
MTRKKWTSKTIVTPELLHFRNKRKWQLALRRYVLEKKPSSDYGPYFGLDNENFRKWIELQFTTELSWDNFASSWQFDHIVPVGYFDFCEEEDLRVCWNFINIRVEKIFQNKKRGNRIDVLAVKPYFQNLFDKTGHPICFKMLEKIDRIEVSNLVSEPKIEEFILERKEHFEILSTLSKEEFALLNQGKLLSDIIWEREIIRKFG